MSAISIGTVFSVLLTKQLKQLCCYGQVNKDVCTYCTALGDSEAACLEARELEDTGLAKRQVKKVTFSADDLMMPSGGLFRAASSSDVGLEWFGSSPRPCRALCMKSSF